MRFLAGYRSKFTASSEAEFCLNLNGFLKTLKTRDTHPIYVEYNGKWHRFGRITEHVVSYVYVKRGMSAAAIRDIYNIACQYVHDVETFDKRLRETIIPCATGTRLRLVK